MGSSLVAVTRAPSPLPMLIWYNTPTPWMATSNIQTSKNHHHFFIRIPMLGHVLVHSVDKTHVLVVTVELICYCSWINTFFNFVLIPNKSLRFARFRRSYVNRTAFIPTNHCQGYTVFCLMYAAQSGHIPFFANACPQCICVTYFSWAHVLLECYFLQGG